MASFVGTLEEFKRYLGPRCRVLVQQLTKKYKLEIAACEHCGAVTKLESAHVHGRERIQIIESILSSYTTNGIVTIELSDFEIQFKSEHTPFEKSILILCRPCHQKYDSSVKADPTDTLPQPMEQQVDQKVSSKLPITLSPSIPEDFKRLLLNKQLAKIEIWYQDGTVDVRQWNARSFKQSSNVMGNLRSRPEFRAGKWQDLGIVKVHVKVEENI